MCWSFYNTLSLLMSPYLLDAFNHILVLEDDFLAHIFCDQKGDVWVSIRQQKNLPVVTPVGLGVR